MSTNARVDTTSRLGGLDGLRGVAAVVVVIWHALLTTTIPEEVPYLIGSTETTTDPAVGSLAWWLFDTPLRLLSMGSNAVIVFFVLSGVVLAVPVFRGARLDLWNYYPRRVLRLWLPSAAAVIFAMLIITATNQDPANAESAWGREFSYTHLEPNIVMSSFFLITGSNDYNNPLWSLKWELLFSLVLPVALLIGLTLSSVTGLWAAIMAAALLSGIGEGFEVSGLQYGSMFLAGVLLARLISLRTRTPSPGVSWALAGLGLLGLAVPDIYRTVWDGDMHGHVGRPLGGFVVLGAALLVYALTVPSALTRGFASKPIAFLGRISFSLYLVHAPILLAGAHVFGDARAALWVSVPASFGIAWVFARFVEEPSARLAKAAGRKAAALANSDEREPAARR